jgi:hypothetical protein
MITGVKAAAIRGFDEAVSGVIDEAVRGGFDEAASGAAAPIVNREDRKFFRFIFTIELILSRHWSRLKITTLKICVHFGLSCLCYQVVGGGRVHRI